MSQEKTNSQSPQPPSKSKLEASHSPDEEPFLGQRINSSQTPSVLEKFQLMWNGALAKIRSLLPENLASKLSDRSLAGIIIAIAFVLLGLSVNTFSSQKPSEIATVNPQTEVSKSNPTPQLKSVKSTTPPKEQITQSPVSPPQKSQSEPKDTITSSNIDNSQSLVEQKKTSSKLDKKQTIETKQQPTKKQQALVLTPEQTLVAIVENQIAEVTSGLYENSKDQAFPTNPIESVQADFATSTLTLKISDAWYSLKQPQQNKLAAKILKRSKKLDFSHLEIMDSKNKLIARNPVIGNEMIIFKR